MKFTLWDYQIDAVDDVLCNLKKAKKDWHGDAYKSHFSLTAVTGAGKTVMAAAVFEALFYVTTNSIFDADPGAVVIWFSDDPALNEQTRFRLMEASDRLNHTDLIPVENTFNRDKFEAKKVYFLNTQSSARIVCWCAASIKTNKKQGPECGRWNSGLTYGHIRSGILYRTRLKTRI